MSLLPHPLYRAAAVRELDRLLIGAHAIAGVTLMNRAGEAVFAALRRRWPQARRIAVVCGTGNNGGDGFVVARLARQAGWQVAVGQVGESARLAGDARTVFEAMRTAGIAGRPFTPDTLADVDLIVDALFGTGLDREIAGPWRDAIDAINRSGRPVVSIDMPSGLDADTGAVLGAAVRAAMTVTFIALKRGMFTASGPACCGEIVLDDLQAPPDVYRNVAPDAHRTDLQQVRTYLAPRPRDAHKGHYGHVLIVGGERGMPGATCMAGAAAARVGAGLVTVATHPAHAAVIPMRHPELMCHGVETAADLRALMPRATVMAVGPGLGRSDWSRRLLTQALDTTLPRVIDADALNLLAAEPIRCPDWILTPHPGEAARLLDVPVHEVQRDRFAAVRALQQRYGGTVVLKGSGTLIADRQGGVTVCDAGNPGMASGGMGDVLTGVIAGLLAQRLDPDAAAIVGVWLHAAAADAAAQADGERGLLATDLLPALRRLANPAT